jgi:nicotinate-nucleotide pyrophosphorylase (carboxylating)
MTPVPAPHDLPQQVERALEEDIGGGDLTAALIPNEALGQASVITREAAVVCGIPYVEAVFGRLDRTVRERGSPRKRSCSTSGDRRGRC